MRRAQTLRSWYRQPNRVGEAPEQPKHSAKKDTKRWCRGKVGVEHAYSWQEDHGFMFGCKDVWALRCGACLKIKDRCLSAWFGCKCGNHKAATAEVRPWVS